MNSKSVKKGGKHNMYGKLKRFIAGFLAVLMVVCMLPVDIFGAVGVVYAAAEDVELGEEGDAETYTDTDAGADTDAVTDAGVDTDTDAGADTDTDAGADTDTDANTVTDDSNIGAVDLPAMDIAEPEPEETDITNAAVELSETVQRDESAVKTSTKTVYKLDPRGINLENNTDLTGETLGTNGYFTMGNGAKFYANPSSTAYTFKDNVPDNTFIDAEGNETTLTGNLKNFILIHDGGMNNGSNLIKFTTETENAEIEIYAALRYNANTDTNPNQKLVILYETDNSKDLQTDVLKLDPMTPGEIIKCTATLESEGTYYVGFTGSGGAFAYAAVTETQYAVKAPTAAPKAGYVAAGTTVKLSSEDENAEIYYITYDADHVDAEGFRAPKASDIPFDGTRYMGGIEIYESMTVFAVAKIGTECSKVASFRYDTVRKIVYKLDPREIKSDPVKYDTGTKLGTNGYFTTGSGAKFDPVPNDYTYIANVPDNTIIDAEGKETTLTGNPKNAIFITGGAMKNGSNLIKFTTKTDYAKIEVYAALKPNADDGKKIVIARSDDPTYYENDDDFGILSMNKGDIIRCIATLKEADTYYLGFNGGGGAIAYVTVTEDKDVSEYLEPPTVSPGEGAVLHEGDEVRLDWDDEAAEVYYTTGATYNAAVDPRTAPDDKKHKYERPIIIDADSRFIKAYAVKGEEKSEVAEFEFTLQVEAPTATPDNIVLKDGDVIELSSKTKDAKIYYSIDDPDIGISDRLYTKGFTIDKTSTIKAYAEKNGFEASEEVEFLYIVPSDKTDYFTLDADSSWIDHYFTPYNGGCGNISSVSQLNALNDWKAFDDVSETPYEDAFLLKDGSMPSAGNEPKNCITFATSAPDTKVVVYFATKATSGAKLTIAKYAGGKVGEHFTDDAVEGSNTKITKAEFRLTEAGIYCIGFVGGAGGAGGGIIPYMVVTENPITLTFMDGEEIFTTRSVYKGEEFKFADYASLYINDDTGKRAFLGWNTEKDNAELAVMESITPTKDTTLYAVWQKLFTVTLEPGDEAIETEFEGFPKVVFEGDEVRLPSASPKTEGYAFRGWTKKGAEGAEIIPAFSLYTPTEDITLVPVFADNNTLFTVGRDYGYDGKRDNITVVKGSDGKAEVTLNDLGTPTRDGYTFEGWVALDEDGNETENIIVEDTDSVKIADDSTTFLAKWKKITTYNVSFVDKDDHVLALKVKDKDGNRVADLGKVPKDTVIVLPDAPEDSVKGSENAAWVWEVVTTDGDAETEEYAVGYKYTVIGDVVFKGYWKAAPTFNPTVAAGTTPFEYTFPTTEGKVKIELGEGATEGTKIYYVLSTEADKYAAFVNAAAEISVYTENGREYTAAMDTAGGIPVTDGMTIKAVAIKGGKASEVVTSPVYKLGTMSTLEGTVTATQTPSGNIKVGDDVKVTLSYDGTATGVKYLYTVGTDANAEPGFSALPANTPTAGSRSYDDATGIVIPTAAAGTVYVKVLAYTETTTGEGENATTTVTAVASALMERTYTVLSDDPGGPALTDVSLSGTARVGSTLTANLTFDPAQTSDPEGVIYKWYRSSETDPISGATTKSYTLTADDEGKTVKVVVTYGDTTKEAATATTVAPNTSNINGNGIEIKFDEGSTYIYTGAKITPSITVYNNGTPLVEGTDYTVKYTNNLNASEKVNDDGTLSAATDNDKKWPTVTVTGKGALSKKVTANFKIVPKALDKKDDVADAANIDTVPEVKADGVVVTTGKKAAPVLLYGGVKLAVKKNFTYNTETDKDKKDWADGAELVLNGANNFMGSTTLTVSVLDAAAQRDAKISADFDGGKTAVANLCYDGTEHKPVFVVKNKAGLTSKADTESQAETETTTLLQEGTDFVISYPSDTVNVGSKKVIITGISKNCVGTVTKTYKVKPADKNAGAFVAENVNPAGYDYVSTGVTFKLTGDDEDVVTFKYVPNASDNENGRAISTYGEELVPGKDFKISYSNNKKVGDAAKYTVTGLGNYKGVVLKDTFKINGISLSNENDNIKVTVADVFYNKKGAYKSVPYVTVNGSLLKSSEYVAWYTLAGDGEEPVKNKTRKIEDTDFAEGVDSITVTVTIEKKGKNVVEPDESKQETKKTATFNIIKKADGYDKTKDLSKAKITFYGGDTKNKVGYTGKPVYPTSMVVKLGSVEETVALDATGQPVDATKKYVIVYADNVAKGKATAVVMADEGSDYVGGKAGTFNIVPKVLDSLPDGEGFIITSFMKGLFGK